MLIFYVRHGDPIYDPDTLTPLGERQAESVAKRLALFGIDEIYASTSTRAIQTAQPLCELTNKKLTTLGFLNENDIEPLLKLPVDGGPKISWVWSHPQYSEVLARRDVREMGDEWYNHPELEQFRFGDVIEPIYEKIDDFIASHGYEHDREKGLYKVTERNYEKRIAIFAHECMAKIFMSRLLDIPFPYYAAHFEMKHTGVTVVRFDDAASRNAGDVPKEYARARMLTMSNDSHLYRDGLPLVHASTSMRDRY
jgi:probable phosphoglycerate mutase